MPSHPLRSIFSTLWLAIITLGFVAVPPASGQLLPGGGETAAPEAVSDPFGRDTPRSAITGLLRVLSDQNYAAAAPYLALPPGESDNAAALAVSLQAALDAGGSLRSYGELSNDAAGRIDDGLAQNLEQVGTLGGAAAIPILLQRQEGENGNAFWQIAPETLQALQPTPAQVEAARETPERDTIGGAPLRDWITLVGLLLIAFAAFWLVSRLILYIICHFLPADGAVSRVLHAALPPLALFLALVTFRVYSETAEVSIVARQVLLRYGGILGVVALAWFGFRLVDAVARGLAARMAHAERRQAVSLIVFAKRVIKTALLAVALIAILDTLGFNVTTGVAALGIGGLVLALGAQKSVENFVGTVTVLADRPVQVGDFCRVGEVMGTIEDIGIRSTRIRTNERTIVTIPNGDFSSQRIENFSARDRFLFQVNVGVEPDLPAAKIREAVAVLEAVLADQPQVLAEPRRATLKALLADSMSIEAFAYIDTADYAESLAIRQELLLRFHERLSEIGIATAYPAHTVYLRGEPSPAAS